MKQLFFLLSLPLCAGSYFSTHPDQLKEREISDTIIPLPEEPPESDQPKQLPSDDEPIPATIEPQEDDKATPEPYKSTEEEEEAVRPEAPASPRQEFEENEQRFSEDLQTPPPDEDQIENNEEAFDQQLKQSNTESQ